jgi:hypothetical protein
LALAEVSDAALAWSPAPVATCVMVLAICWVAVPV